MCLLCLPSAGTVEPAQCSVAGYGRPARPSPLPRAALHWEADSAGDGILREAELQISPAGECGAGPGGGAGPGNMTGLLCGTGRGEEEACFTGLDGGSPLSCQDETGSHYLAGIVIFSTACGGDNPSLFIRIVDYVQWLQDSYAVIKDYN